jgi:hypothetical protein
MKKLIAIAVVFALAAFAAFAETTVSGSLDVRFTAISDNSVNPERDDVGSNPQIFGGIAGAYIQLSGTNEDNTVGGVWRMRMQDLDPAFKGQDDGSSTDGRRRAAWHRTFVWWKPIPQLRVFLGMDQDGMFNPDNPLVGWGFHQGPEAFLAVHDWNLWRDVFAGHWEGFGLAFSIYPTQGLAINLTIPTGIQAWPYTAQDSAVTYKRDLDRVFFASLKLEAEYAIPDIGKVFFAWDGPGANGGERSAWPPTSAPLDSGITGGYYWENNAYEKEYGYFGRLGASFLLEALQSMGLRAHIGFSTELLGSEIAWSAPFRLGLGVHYTGEGFGVKFRTAAIFQQVSKAQTIAGVDIAAVNSTFLTANVMPWVKLDFMTVYLDLGLSIDTNNVKDRYDTYRDGFAWWITPYAKVPLGGPSLEFGLNLYSGLSDMGSQATTEGTNTLKDAPHTAVNYAIPLRFVFNF